MQIGDYKELKLRLDGFLKPAEQHKRNVLLETVYGSLPKDAEANVLVFSAEIAPSGYTSGTATTAQPFSCALRVFSRPISRRARW